MTFNVNVRGTLFTVQKALPLMRDGGSVIMTDPSRASKVSQEWASTMQQSGNPFLRPYLDNRSERPENPRQRPQPRHNRHRRLCRLCKRSQGSVRISDPDGLDRRAGTNRQKPRFSSHRTTPASSRA